MFPAVGAASGPVHNTELQLTSAYVLGRTSCTEMGLVRSLLGCSRTSRKSLTCDSDCRRQLPSVVTALLANRCVLRKKAGRSRSLFSPQMPEINPL